MIKKNTFIASSTFYGRLKRLASRITIEQTDHIIAASKMVSKLLKKRFFVSGDKVSVVIHLGVDTEHFLPTPSNISKNLVTIGYCGKFELHKGVTDLIEAIKMLKQKNDDFAPVRLMLLGGGSLMPSLKKEQLKSTWLEVYQEVPIEKVAQFLNKLDIFVMPSRVLKDHQEHDAHALMEAMSTGIACIGTRSGIIPEIIENGTGVLVDPESPKELSNSLSNLIVNKKERDRLGKLAREKAVREFTIDIIARQKFDILSKITNKS